MSAAPSDSPWIQSLDGRAIDLIDPQVADVDFCEIARTLARINRYSGASETPVSVALHTLIAVLCAPPELAPWVLLHDAHEARIGDITTPVRQVFAKLCGAAFEWALHALAHVHDVTIHAAAGLPLPTPDQIVAIADADRKALVTERALFLEAPPRPWGAANEAEPLPLTCKDAEQIRSWADVCPDETAWLLIEAFAQHLPIFKRLEPLHD